MPVTSPDFRPQPLFVRLGGRRSEAMEFVIDGQPARAFVGDLLITAILTNRGELRRFEFADACAPAFA